MADNLTQAEIELGAELGTEDDGGVHYSKVVTAGKAKLIEVSVATDTAVYASGDVLGGEISIPNAVRSGPKSGILATLGLRSKLALTMPFRVYLFDDNPSGTYTDNAAFALDSGDFDNLIGVVEFFPADFITASGAYVIANRDLFRPITLAGTTLYAVIVAIGAPDFVGATDLDLLAGVLQD